MVLPLPQRITMQVYSFIHMYTPVKEPFLKFVTYHLEQDNEKDLLHFLERYIQKLVSNCTYDALRQLISDNYYC